MYEGDDPATTRSGAFRPRGRHRRPRPRKVVLAAGGLAFAAGVLGLLRVVPDGTGGGPVAGASAGDDGGTGTGVGDGGLGREGYAGGVTDRATNAAVAVPVPSGGAVSRVPDPPITPRTSGVPRPSAPPQELPVSPEPSSTTPTTTPAPNPTHTASPAPSPPPTHTPTGR